MWCWNSHSYVCKSKITLRCTSDHSEAVENVDYVLFPGCIALAWATAGNGVQTGLCTDSTYASCAHFWSTTSEQSLPITRRLALITLCVTCCDVLYMGLPLKVTWELHLIQKTWDVMSIHICPCNNYVLLHSLTVGSDKFEMLVLPYKLLHGVRPG